MNIEFADRDFVGYFKYHGHSLGVFYQITGDPHSNFFVLPLIMKSSIIDEKMEGEQLDNFGPALKFLPQVYLDLSSTKSLPYRTQKEPVYVVDVVYFLDRTLIFRAGTTGVFGIQYLFNDGKYQRNEAPYDFPPFKFTGILWRLPATVDESVAYINTEHSFFVFKNNLASLLTNLLIGIRKPVPQRVYGSFGASKQNISRLFTRETFETVSKDGFRSVAEASHGTVSQFIHENNQVRRVRLEADRVFVDIINVKALSTLLGSSYWYYPVIQGD